MIVISLKRLIINFLLILISFIIYIFTSINLFSEFPINLSIEKQEILFWGIIIIIFQSLIFLTVFIDHRRLILDLKKIISYKDLNHPHSIKIINQLGEIGTVINTMLSDFNQLLELRLNRITAFNKVLKTICEEYPEPIIITDNMGTILGVSNILCTKLNITITINSLINEIFPDLKIASIMALLEKNRDIWKDESGTGLNCSPIFDRNANLNLCIWELDSNQLFQKFSSKKVNDISKNTLKSLKGILRKKKAEN